MSKQVILLGAGAVIPMGAPSTKSLTNKIRQVKDMSEIVGMIDDYYDTECSFETYIAAIESLLSYSISKQAIGKTPSNSNILPALYDYKLGNINDAEWPWNVYSNCINNIISGIKEYAFEHISPKWEEYFNYINKQLDKGDQVKIYSLNYDRVIPSFWRNHEIGIYEGTDEYGNMEFDLKHFQESQCTYFNLHGSIFLRSDNSISGTPQSLYRAKLIEGGNPGGNVLFSPIITGHSKTQRILSEPFNWGISAFNSDINSADKLVIIGYSFGDPHINAIIKQKLSNTNALEISIIDFAHENKTLESIMIKIANVLRVSSKWIERYPQIFILEDTGITLNANGTEDFLKS